ncbi:hypothetical protein LOC68_09955 [Blastopirellula sp. JC732]|uniref:Uncharacterized protein n=1 Tax=Blastopirellula sediminis TaxID=2894196 RepID=A0A9X1SG87_9BACT|nr:hypothetical protein [Blastopirellula sediminis]MCC9608501.1 hypothetical protein [Blastopirellula sediminis]MCC9628722.1 hypothetical protein [Blastopirellula sediminis]
MAMIVCPGCHEEVDGNLDACPQCGLSFLVSSEAVVGNSQIREIAIGQKWVIYSLLANILTLFATLGMQGADVPPAARMAIWMPVVVLQLFSLCKLTVALRMHPISIVLSCVALVFPCISLIVLLVINQKGIKELEKAGVKIGFMGAKMDTLPPVES